MGSLANRFRTKWQDYSGRNAGRAENDFYTAFHEAFRETNFDIRAKPNEFRNIYVGFPLDRKVQQEIYTPPEPITKHGVFPDYAIDNSENEKTIYIEVKRQDGWVEGKTRAAGRGNAHERSCKFFTPGLQKMLREQGKIDNKFLPFWTVFVGDITRDPCRVREVSCWYQGYEGNFFFWRDTSDTDSLYEHFEEYIVPIIS